jgi:hypothetical protein
MNAPLNPAQPQKLNRQTVVDAVSDYILQVNHGSYQPDRQKVLTVRKTDRTASLRDAAVPVRGEVYYFIEGELFSRVDATRLREGETPEALAEKLVGEIWDDLWVWNAYDFTRSTSGMNAP